MEILRRPAGEPAGEHASIGILPSAFDPPTIAHLELARAGLRHVDQVLFVLPRALPHKTFEGVAFEARLEMLLAASAEEPLCGVAVTRGGLFIDIARECREVFGARAAIWFLCGRDAAERIVNWDYGPGASPHASPDASLDTMLGEFGLLVADRGGPFAPPERIAGRVRALDVEGALDEVSSSGVRRRAAAGDPWEHAVPAGIRALVRKHYGVIDPASGR